MLLRPGLPAPRQSTPTTCGSACLVVARALADPAFDAWLATGRAAGARALGGVDPAERFGRYEAVVKARTVALRTPSGWQVPWLAALGTPPWAAAVELAAATGTRPVDQRTVLTRGLGTPQRERALRDAVAALTPTRPALLYTGSEWLPRHVVLLAVGDDGPVVYEPSGGEVVAADVAALARDCSPVGGWPHLWAIVRPRAGGVSTRP